ncbi:hypothetical protein A9Q81_18350 [Gammaproteobacteria bacterium 42_54_T18]|nr:hypothetical protein A9Q81_18350 [Gammaproteobacteria bacterium 42_54_T18]
MKTTKVISKYLAHYAENLSPWLDGFSRNNPFQRCVVIPAFDESTYFIDRLNNQAPDNTLIILVLNCPKTCTPLQRSNTLKVKEHLLDLGQSIWQGSKDNAVQLIQTPSTHWLVWDITGWNDITPIDTFVPGVGYARKLGMDSALLLFSQNQITAPFFLSTDADALLPNDYFELPSLVNQYTQKERTNCSGYIFPFQHDYLTNSPSKEESNTTSIAASIYEMSLRYYVLGLRWAESPWGFHTIGSTLAIHAFHYAANRGFPKREAGEDFYLLNKIAKTGTVISLKKPVITLSDRASHRVPFGTGPAVQRIQQLDSIVNEFRLYHPSCFEWLKLWQLAIPRLYTQPLTVSLIEVQSDVEVCEKIHGILLALNIEKAINHSRKQSKSADDFYRHMLTWFDAFKTLKFIHTARNKYLPSLKLCEWIQAIELSNIPFITQPAPSQLKWIQLTENLSQKDLQCKINHLSQHLTALDQSTLPHTSSI